MKIITIILKSGTKMDVSEAEKIEPVSREILEMEHKGIYIHEEMEWRPAPKKIIKSYLRIIKEGSFWEVDESEIAAFQYLQDKGSGDIKI